MTQGDRTLVQQATTALDSFCAVLAKDRPLKLLLLLSLAMAIVFCLTVFDTGFLMGTSPFWNNPRGVVENGWADITTSLSSYTYFQRDTWQLPLFHISKLGAPEGTNVLFTDGLPWIAIPGRLIFRATGIAVNLLGIWTGFCFAASAMTLTALAATLGQRNLATAAMASVVGLCMPALLARWGHVSLMAQFEIPLAMIFYLRNRRSDKAWPVFLQAGALMWLALWTFPYLFVMVSAIVLATIAQTVSNRTLKIADAALLVAGLAAVVGATIALSGHLQTRGALGAEGVGIYSMNLLSPFFPQRSGLYPSLGDVIADGTGGQYEGFSYLGAGVLALLLMTLPWQRQKLRYGWREHTWLIGLFIGFTLCALSNVIYLGSLQLLHISLPDRILQFASMFRATGRFFWPVMYSLAALAIAGPIAFYGQRGVLLLLVALPLQWIDTAPLRQALAASTHAPEKPHINLNAWQAAIARHDSIRVLPQFFCLAVRRGWNSEVAMQLQLLAAFADRPINTVYTARQTADCRAEQPIVGTPRAGARQLSVFLDEFSGFSRMQAQAETGGACRAGPHIIVCSDIPGEAEILGELVRTDRQ